MNETQRDDIIDLMRKVADQKVEIGRLQAIVDLLPKKDGLPVVPRIDPADGTAERLGIVFRYE